MEGVVHPSPNSDADSLGRLTAGVRTNSRGRPDFHLCTSNAVLVQRKLSAQLL
jgi:hypothetical protein